MTIITFDTKISTQKPSVDHQLLSHWIKMASNLFFIPKMQVFKSLTKISVYHILTNNFKVNSSRNLKPEYCVPIKQFFQEINFFYETSIDNHKMTVHRIKHWFYPFILLIQVFNLLRCLTYIFWDEEDKLIRLYGGDLVVFFGLNSKFFTIPQAGVSFYIIATFYLLFYSPVNHVAWLNTFNAIEGKQSFIQSKIFIQKSAKNLIRFSLFLIINGISLNYFTLMFCMFGFLFFPFINLPLNLFILFAVPWAGVITTWIYHNCSYGFSNLIILITGYYYEIRLNQLDLYIKLYLRHQKFAKINQQINKLLFEYIEIINGMNQLNKFASKMMFSVLLFMSSTLVFLIFNIIYIKLDRIVYLLYIVFAVDVAFVISAILISAVRLSSKIRRNKRNFIALIYIKNLQIRNKIKVNCCTKITIKSKLYFFIS